MIIEDVREETNETFGKLRAGDVFYCPSIDAGINPFMKMGEDCSSAINEDWSSASGWFAVNLFNGEFLYIDDEIEVTEVEAIVSIR